MPTARALLTSLFLVTPFLVAPAILAAAPRPATTVAAAQTTVPSAPVATLAASPSGKLKVVPVRAGRAEVEALPCKATTIIRTHASGHLPRQVVALN
ncbi:hypothetical protein [Azospirillum sp. B4]|uniref:hypothetical protein n=1 Tax=Azospirillum sp. B4 TaxID=95605 RepID=UPI000346F62C|nr:hypothetical protein [Azospirillum sp. B4]